MSLAVKETETKNLLETLANESPVGLYIIQDGRFCYTNPTFQSITGYTEDELVGRDALDFVIPEDKERVRENAIKMLKGELALPYQFRVTHKNGSIKWVMESVVSVQYLRRRATLGDFIDITEHKQVEDKVQHLNLVLRAIRDNNQLIARGTDRDSLLKGACDTFVKTRGYYGAWIALLDESGKLVTAAEAGLGKNFLQVMDRLKRGELTHCGYKVLEKPGVLVMKDVSSECADCPVAKKEDTGRGAISVRLEHGGKVYGLMTVSIPPGRAVEKEEHDLLEEIAGDIAFALHGIEQEQDRKQAEEELQEAEAEKSALLEGAPIAILNADLKGKITYVNKRFELESGYSREEIVGKNGLKLDWLPAGTMKYLTQRMAARLRGEPSKHWETQLKCKDGQWIWIEIEGRVLRKSGVPIGFQIIARNITERKRAETELKLRAQILDSATDAIFVHDNDDNFIYVNEAACRIHGYTREEFLKMKLHQLVDPDRSRPLALDRQIIQEKGHLVVESTHLRKDGSPIPVEVHARTIESGEGKLFLTVARDITERKQAEETLQNEKNKLQSIVDAMEDGLSIRDRDYNIIYQGRLQRSIVGDHLGEKCYRVYEGREKVCEGCPAEKAFKDGKSHTAEKRMVEPSGKISFWENTANPIRDASGEIVSCLEINRNITERKQAEETLQAEKNKLQSLVDAMEDTLTIQDPEYNIIYQNEQSRIASGGDHLGEKCYRVYEGRETVCDGCPVEMAFKDGKSHTAERMTTIMGKVTFWENTANPIRDAKGKIVSCLEITRDITERKKAEDELRKTQAQLSSAVQMAQLGPWEYDAINDLFIFNDAFYELFHTTAEEVGGYTMSSAEYARRFVHPEDSHLVGEEVRKALEVDDPNFTGQLDHRIIYQNGEVGYISVHFFIIKDETGITVRTYGVNQDITERKRAEEVLQTERNKLQSVIDAMEDGLTIQDRDYNIIYQNEPARISTGGDRTGEKCYRVYGSREKVCEGCPVERAFKDGKSHTAERQRVLPSGELSFWENTANPIRDARGKIVSCLEIGRNITERKKQEQALADELTQRRLLVDKSLDGIVVLDVDASVVEANQRFADMLGYTLEEVHKLHTWDWDKEFPPEKILEMGRNVDEKGLHLETKHTRKDGSVIDVDISISGIKYGGQKLIFCIQRDITERKQAKEVLQVEKNKLQSVIDAMANTLTIQDTEYNIIFQNEPSKIIYGDHLGEKCYRIFAGRDKKCTKCPVEESFKDGKPHSVEKMNKLPSGDIIFWEITANPIRDARGSIISCLEIGRDITERKEQEQALAEQLTRRRLLIDQSVDGIVVIDENDKVYEANQHFADMLGYTFEEVHKLHTWDWEKNLSRDEIHELGRQADEKGFILETTHTRKDGSIIDVDISINASMVRGRKLIFCVCRDVTERKKAERALADELARRRLLVDKSLDAIVVLDVDARVVEANQRFAEMLGYTLEEVYKLHTWDWDKQFPPEKILEMGRNVDEKGLHLETKHTRKDGSVIDVDISISGIMYGGQKLIFCIQRDVTERNRAEKAIRDSEESYRELADSITEVFFAMDEHLKYTYWNKASEILTGVRAKDALGKSLQDIFPDTPGLKKAEKVYRAVLRTQKSRTFINDFDIDGRHYIFEIGAYPSRGGISVFVRDITERKKMEEAIRHAAEEWRKTFDSISDAISIHDRNFRIQRANKAFADIFNMQPSQIIGEHCYELHKGQKPISGCPHQQSLATGKPAAAELYESHLGKYLLESTSPIFNEKGEIVGTVHITRDITEQKQQNERLVIADRLASIGELAAGAAHELNNPLTSIIGFSQLLMEKDIPDDAREDVELIYNEAQRAANVTRSLLTFGRKHAPVKQPNQINNIIEDVLKLRTYEQNVNGIKVKKLLAPHLPEIMADYFQMQQVFLNIIINAEYFMTEARKRGTLTITTKKQNSNVRISFTDDGPGISRENLSQVFNPFFTTKEAGKGTGLGLSICHGIVSEHGGQIYARSQPGKGATIIVELPINNH